MDFETTALLAFSFVTCVATCAGVYYLTEVRKAEITQAGIDRRAMQKLQSGESVPERKEWYLELGAELLKNPEISKQIAPYLPSIAEKIGLKKV